MARRGVFVRAEEVAFLEEAARLRRTCIDVLSRAKPQGPLYKATEGIVDAIDGLAEVVTGDRRRFHQRDVTTPGETFSAPRSGASGPALMRQRKRQPPPAVPSARSRTVLQRYRPARSRACASRPV